MLNYMMHNHLISIRHVSCEFMTSQWICSHLTCIYLSRRYRCTCFREESHAADPDTNQNTCSYLRVPMHVHVINCVDLRKSNIFEHCHTLCVHCRLACWNARHIACGECWVNLRLEWVGLMLGQSASRVGGPDVRSLSVSSGWGECWVNLRLEWAERCAKHCHMIY